MTKYYVVFVLCALLALGAAASAIAGTGASFYGPTGLMFVPTADTLGMGEVSVFTNDLSRGGVSMTPYGINAGLGYGLEVGGTEIHANKGGLNEGIVNAKWTAFKGNLVMPAIAVGALNVTENNFMGKIQPYAVATKSITIPKVASLSVSAGYWAGTVNKAMFGAKLGLTSKLDLIADYIPDFTKLGVGARYNAASGLGLQAGVIDGDFAAGFTYSRTIGK